MTCSAPDTQLFFLIVFHFPKTAFLFEISPENKFVEPMFGPAKKSFVDFIVWGIIITLLGLSPASLRALFVPSSHGRAISARAVTPHAAPARSHFGLWVRTMGRAMPASTPHRRTHILRRPTLRWRPEATAVLIANRIARTWAASTLAPNTFYMGSNYRDFDTDAEAGVSTALDFKVTACVRPMLEALRAVQTVTAFSAELLAVEARMPWGSLGRAPSLSPCAAGDGGGEQAGSPSGEAIAVHLVGGELVGSLVVGAGTVSECREWARLDTQCACCVGTFVGS